jgi:amino acid adenylation domain-containing protein
VCIDLKNQLQKAMLLRTDRYNQMRLFWEKQINGLDQSGSGVKGEAAGQPVVLRIQLEEKMTSRLMKVSRGDHFSLFALLMSGLQLAAHYYWDKKSIVIATPALLELVTADTFGRFVLNVSCEDENIAFADYAKLVKSKLEKVYRNQDYPIDELWKESLGWEFGQDDILISARLPQLHGSFPVQLQGTTMVTFIVEEGTIELEVSFFESRIESFVMSRILECWQYGMTELLTAPQTKIKEAIFLSLEMQEAIMVDSGGECALSAFEEMNLAVMLDQQSASYPERIAVWASGQSISYRDLCERSHQLAAEIHDKGIAPGSIIALGANRTLETIIGIIGIIKAGCAYLPIDPGWPQDRIDDILLDSGVQAVVVSGSPVPGTDGLAQIQSEIPLSKENSFSSPCFSVHDLVYVLYTSGSTGKPKGVMIEHQNLINLVDGLKRKVFDRYGPSRVACVAPLYFDASVKQIFSALLLGHSLYLVPDDIRLNGEALWQFYQEHTIEISDGTPMHLQMLSLVGKRRHAGNLALRHLMIGGEALPASVVQEFLLLCGKSAPLITNVYGPTECCVDTTAYEIDFRGASSMPAVVPIGRPLMNQGVYILDKQMRLRPVGAPGELYISGLNVGRGYLNRSELTSERFIEHPIAGGSILYRTGDRVRWLPDGNVDFLGRTDFQIKINGYRIELGEVEQALLSYEGITAVVAIPAGESTENLTLAVYFTGRPEITESIARDFLKSKLPAYMVPAHFAKLEKFPLTDNGKIDRRLLASLDLQKDSVHESDLPRTEMELTVWEAWERVLTQKGWGTQDSFFEFGGDSLKALRLMLELEDRGIKVKLHEIFQYQTIRGLASKLTTSNTSSSEAGMENKVDLEQLFRRNGLPVHAVTVTIEDEIKTVWYLAAENYEKGRSLIYQMRSQYPPHVFPHFVLRANVDSEWINSEVNPMNEEEWPRIIEGCMNNNLQYAMEIKQLPVKREFPLAPIQHAFLQSAAANSGTIIPLDTSWDADFIRETIFSVIREQALFRCELKFSNNLSVWIEHEDQGDAAIPYCDLSGFPPAEQLLLQNVLVSRLFYDPYLNEAHLLYRVALLKLNERDYRLVLACHHAVYDEMSGELIGKTIAERLAEGQSWRERISEYPRHYQDYVMQINKGPVLKEEEIISIFSLDCYDRSASQLHKWLLGMSGSVLQTSLIEVPLQQYGKHLTTEHLFDASFAIVQQICLDQGLSGNLPLLLFHYGRRYEGAAFFNTAGVFIDVMPFTLKRDMENPGARISEQLRILSDHNINFTAFLFGQAQLDDYPRLSSMIDPSQHSGVWFNYHGRVEDSKMKLFSSIKRQKQDNVSDLDGNQLFGGPAISIDVSYSDDRYRLSITCPFMLSVDKIKSDIERSFTSLILAPVGVD